MVRVVAADRVNQRGTKRTVQFVYEDETGRRLPLEVRLVATGEAGAVAAIVDAIIGTEA